MTREKIIEGLKLLEDNMTHFDELQNDKGEWIDVHELLFETISALEQEPTTIVRTYFEELPTCDDTISLEAVNEIWHTQYCCNREENEEEQYKRIQQLPSVKPSRPCDSCKHWEDRCTWLPSRKGHWIEHNAKCFECSECHNENGLYASYKTDFCHDCGAEMRGVE